MGGGVKDFGGHAGVTRLQRRLRPVGFRVSEHQATCGRYRSISNCVKGFESLLDLQDIHTNGC